jgi:bifunctional N-acetylglucosamine-1-phosphate-uridyltransferase/glucosamine-1-phosphate-acetyltransferase GlmU-like protein
MRGFAGRALVIWGTQPVVRPETMRRTLKLAELFATCEMVLPTVHKESPYAPLIRDENGTVQAARETHLEQAEQMPSGETNIGLFLLQSEAMFEALVDLKQRYWNEKEQRYNRRGAELGFPNELINYFAAQENGVFAAPIADWREEQGIKTLADIARCERFISELAEQK